MNRKINVLNNVIVTLNLLWSGFYVCVFLYQIRTDAMKLIVEDGVFVALIELNHITLNNRWPETVITSIYILMYAVIFILACVSVTADLRRRKTRDVYFNNKISNEILPVLFIIMNIYFILYPIMFYRSALFLVLRFTFFINKNNFVQSDLFTYFNLQKTIPLIFAAGEYAYYEYHRVLKLKTKGTFLCRIY